MDKTKIAMSQNMQNLLARDEKLDTMLKKTETMSDLSYSISKKVLNII
jgi:Synaptobrevin